VSYRDFFFTYRSYTPIPLILAALILAETTPASFICGFIIAICGECLRIWAVRYAGSATRTTGNVGADDLVTTGPYGYVRNPLYLGNFLMSLGILLVAWPWMPWFLILFMLLFAVQYTSIIHLEEEFLAQNFSDRYQDYVQNVPRFIPRIVSWDRGNRQPTGLRRALHTERNTLQSFSAVMVLLVLRWIIF
jgi:protein-S-isoprenylcysteine O-methyltransferase Ste14